MKEYKGFRVDRLADVMKAHGAAIADIVNCEKELSEDGLGRKNQLWLFDILDGSAEPTGFEIFVICEACNCTADYLLGLSDEI